jgi:conjugal transfer mating pair stabilization protein TraG
VAIILDVFTIGGGDLIEEVFNAVASVFNDKAGIASITSLAVLIGGFFAALQFSHSKDVSVLMKWMGCYVLVTSLMLYPKATVNIEDQTGTDINPRIVDNVPLSLAIFSSITSRIGIGFTQVIETVFHMPDDMTYNKTGMLMGSKLVLAASHFQITDAQFSENLSAFMQQCVFFDLLLNKYTVQDLTHVSDPWNFIKQHTSVARAFPLNGQITICKDGAATLDETWKQEINNAATLYGAQIIGGTNAAATMLSYLSDGYHFLTNISAQGDEILKTNVLSNAISQGLAHYGADVNAPAALTVYEDTKSELQTRQTFDETGREAGTWLQQFKNTIEAVAYSLFIFIYFLSYLPFGIGIIKNYLCGLFFIQSLAPMYAIINFAANFYAQGKSLAFITSDISHGSLSIANIKGITQANADAIALAGYLMWPVTIGGAIMIFRGMPSAMQSLGQYVGGVTQNAASHVIAEAVGGNISAGNTNFGNHSQFNTNANHWDTNARYAAGMTTLQTSTGSTLSITSSGSEILDNRGALSNLAVTVHGAESLRTVASHQAQASLSAALNRSHAAGESYGAALRHLDDYSHQKGHSVSSGQSSSLTDTAGFSHSAHTASQLVDSFAKEHHVSHERSAQILGQIYADAKIGGGFITKVGLGGSVSSSISGRSSFGSLYNDAHRFAEDHNFVETVDSAKRDAKESHFRDSTDQGSRLVNSISSSFDQGDSLRFEASSQLSKSESYSTLASTSRENAQSINANYTQEFYEWMRHQPSPSSLYGQGTMSKSAIDNMAVHNPDLMQNYADQFVNDKTAETMKSFEQKHHLAQDEKSVEHVFRENNTKVNEQSHIAGAHSSFNQTVTQDLARAVHKGDGLGKIDVGIKKQVEKDITDRASHIHSEQTALNNNANPLKDRIHDKVKGQVFSSIDGTDGSLWAETIREKPEKGNLFTSIIDKGKPHE